MKLKQICHCLSIKVQDHGRTGDGALCDRWRVMCDRVQLMPEKTFHMINLNLSVYLIYESE